jgi:hypothetical protein
MAEQRLIDANALMEAYLEEQKKPGIYSIAKLIVDAPTVDAVEVVRCKDCKHFVQGEIYDPCECMKWTVKFGVAYTTPDGFCSYGERKDNDHCLHGEDKNDNLSL